MLCSLYHFSMRTTSRATSTNFTFGSAISVSALVTAVMYAYNRHTFTRKKRNMEIVEIAVWCVDVYCYHWPCFYLATCAHKYHWMHSATVHKRNTKSATHNSRFCIASTATRLLRGGHSRRLIAGRRCSGLNKRGARERFGSQGRLK